MKQATKQIKRCMDCDEFFNKETYFCKDLKRIIKPMEIDPECKLQNAETNFKLTIRDSYLELHDLDDDFVTVISRSSAFDYNFTVKSLIKLVYSATGIIEDLRTDE